MKNEYDATIIGAGISGLVCGCYLAKKGLKTLIVEKNDKPGGYCTSIENGGYKFDLGVHSLGNFDEGSILNRIFSDINVLNKLEITKRNSTYTVLMPDLKIEFCSDYKYTLHYLKEKFPKEARNLETFFGIVFKLSTHTLYGLYKNESYQRVIDKHFKDDKIKSLFCVLSGNNAVQSKHLSGFVALMMIRNFVFGGSYNIKSGGVQVLSDNLAKMFLVFGGKIIFNTEIDKIQIKNMKAVGVNFKKNAIKSKYVISASDAYNTFTNMIDEKITNSRITKKISSLMTTSSALVYFFGLRPNSLKLSKRNNNFWYCPNYRGNTYFEDSSDIKEKPLFFSSPTQYDSMLAKNKGDILTSVIISNYDNKVFTVDKMHDTRSYLMRCASETFGISAKDIITEQYVTPRDLRAMTNNYKGAVRGWASSSTQSSRHIFPGEIVYKNLFFTGHWATSEFGQGGISNVANMARRTFESILREESR